MNNEYYLKGLGRFIGGTVEGVVTDNENEYFGFQIKTHGKSKIVWFLRDDEGNGPGSFEIQDVEPEL